MMYNQIVNGEKTIAVIGLGYVGLPIALEFAKKVKVIGFDINEKRVDLMRNKIDPSNELTADAFEGTDIYFTAKIEELKTANFFIVAVPTPVDEHKVPDLVPVLSASKTVGQVLKKGDYVVFESTVYPGCTEEDCLPILEKLSGLRLGTDFKLGYSPERINPGDKEHTLTKITKVVSGNDAEALENVSKVYQMIITAGVHEATSIKVAEAAKVIENTQRDLNISLMNELSMIFDRMGINTHDVLTAAGTKWNFLKFSPGLVGGHCIGVDPYYLTYKSTQLGYKPQVIVSGRNVNDMMSLHIAKRIVQMLIKAQVNINNAKVLIMGVTFKENVSDIRNSKIADLINELKAYNINLDIVDPHASAQEVKHEYGFDLNENIGNGYDCVVLAVNHREYSNYESSFFKSIMAQPGLLVDIKGIYNHKFNDLPYWTL